MWKPQRPQVQDKEDIEEDVDVAEKRREDEVNMNETCQLEKKVEVNIDETLCCPEGENPEDHKFIRAKTWVAKTWNNVNKMDMQWSMEEDDEGRNGKQQCDNVSFPAESMVKKQRENTEEIGTASSLHHTCQACDHHTGGHPKCLPVYVVKKLQRNNKKSVSMVQSWNKKMVPPNLYAIHAKCVTIILEDIQIASQYLQWKSCKVENVNSICGAELKQNSIHGAELKLNSIHGAELKQNSIHGSELKQNSIHGAELKQGGQEYKMIKDEFSASYLTKRRGARWQKMSFLFPIWKRRQYPTKNRVIDCYQDEERNANVDDYSSVHMTLWQSSGE